MSEIISIPILELMEKTEQWLLNQGYKKNTLGVYKATWNKFRAYSSSPFYDRETAEKFLLRYFGVDVNAIDQKLDIRMRHARRHMSALDEFLRTGEICRRKVRGITTIPYDPLDYHNNFNPELRKYMRRAGITVPKEGHAGVHTLRHSFATNLLKDEASLQDIRISD